jgi:hypothetical protein
MVPLRALAALLLLTTPALADTGTQATDLLPVVGALLGKLLLVLLLLESAMAALFNWRVYRVVLSGRAWKTPIMFILGLLVVQGFDYDFMATAITDIAGGSGTVGWLSTTLSALVVAGGSQGVHDLLKRLGLRSPIPDAEEKPALKEDQAWLALRVNRVKAVGDIQIILTETTKPADAPLVGSINDTSLKQRLSEAFGLWHLRFPRTGGRVVKPGITYDLALRYATAEDAAAIYPIGSFAFAPRAIVDLDVTA